MPPLGLKAAVRSWLYEGPEAAIAVKVSLVRTAAICLP